VIDHVKNKIPHALVEVCPAWSDCTLVFSISIYQCPCLLVHLSQQCRKLSRPIVQQLYTPGGIQQDGRSKLEQYIQYVVSGILGHGLALLYMFKRRLRDVTVSLFCFLQLLYSSPRSVILFCRCSVFNPRKWPLNSSDAWNAILRTFLFHFRLPRPMDFASYSNANSIVWTCINNVDK
jgi:hypothetical protein